MLDVGACFNVDRDGKIKMFHCRQRDQVFCKLLPWCASTEAQFVIRACACRDLCLQRLRFCSCCCCCCCCCSGCHCCCCHFFVWLLLLLLFSVDRMEKAMPSLIRTESFTECKSSVSPATPAACRLPSPLPCP